MPEPRRYIPTPAGFLMVLRQGDDARRRTLVTAGLAMSALFVLPSVIYVFRPDFIFGRMDRPVLAGIEPQAH